MKKTFLFLIGIVFFQLLYCQTGSDILMTIDTNKITRDEFLRIYHKNSNLQTGDQKSVDDYLNLFIDYKLKVIEAERLGYDTVSAFKKELSGYQDQLAKPYLEDRESYDNLTKEAYKRAITEINASHIVVAVDENALPKDTLAAYNKALAIRKRILSGEPFEEVARETSKDPSAKENGGNLGWFTAFQMVYPFESAIFKLPVGQISMPVRTAYGYHIMRVNAVRPYRGELLVYLILAYFSPKSSDEVKRAAKEKIDKAYAELENGTPWEEVVTKYSDHKGSAKQGGKLGWIKAGIVPDDFLEGCFATDSGKYSKPFLSAYGWQIVKIMDHKTIPPYDSVKKDYEEKIRNSETVNKIAKQNFLNKVKKEYGFKIFNDNIDKVFALVDSNSLVTGSWNADVAKDLQNTVVSIGNDQFSQYDFAKFLSDKIFQNRRAKFNTVKDKWTNEYVENKLFDYEKKQLPNKYPEFKQLIEEYHDGILLFNLTEDKVWQKAVQDTIGLKNYYSQFPEKYQWKERVQIAKYIYSDTALKANLLKLAKKRIKSGANAKEISASLCPKDTIPCINITDLKFERGDNPIGDSIKWNPGAYLIKKAKHKYNLYYVEKILPPQTKKFDEARGLYTADYQNVLEKQWLSDLRKQYTVSINKVVLEQIKSDENQNKKQK